MPIPLDLQSLKHDTEVELFELSNFNRASPYEAFRFTAHAGVSFGGIPFVPLPCAISGISYTTEGAMPRPKLKLDDSGQYISRLTYLYDGLEGATIKIRRTLKRYLDGQAQANSQAEKPPDFFTISSRTEVPGRAVEFELAADIDFIEETLPRRRCLTKCSSIYRSAECSYAGSAMFTVQGVGTLDPTLDRCGKALKDCALRFGKYAVLPTSGIPGIQRY